MLRTMRLVFFLFVSFISLTARADTMVLIHGYLSNMSSWHNSGVLQVLATDGWQYAGSFSGVAGTTRAESGEKNIYLVDLPSEAPIMVQASYLRPVLKQINDWHPNDKIILIGHSAGGLLARLMVIENVMPNTKALITVATPHLGTPIAADGLDAANTGFPFSMFQSFFDNSTYNMVRRGEALYVDLLPAVPGNFLFWLNSQSHPEIKYHSVVRQFFTPYRGDNLVPSYSQDMNNIPTLRGRSGRTIVDLRHGLHPHDGEILLSILRDI
jgi:triacylglycerol lipase